MDSHEHAVAGRFAWERALLQSGLPPMTRLVGLALATYANRDGTNARPGEDRLASACGLSPRRVREHMGALRDAGYVVRVGRGGSRTRTTDTYRLTLCTADHRTAASGDDDRITGRQRPENPRLDGGMSAPVSADVSADIPRSHSGGNTTDLRTEPAGSPDADDRISGRQRPPTMSYQDNHHPAPSSLPRERGDQHPDRGTDKRAAELDRAIVDLAAKLRPKPSSRKPTEADYQLMEQTP